MNIRNFTPFEKTISVVKYLQIYNLKLFLGFAFLSLSVIVGNERY
ncbi:MAG: hypothetical protein JWP12_2196 [Bacteroidetes bacterium]|nr:hypothetical protein [Bacteroidota bacterium]